MRWQSSDILTNKLQLNLLTSLLYLTKKLGYFLKPLINFLAQSLTHSFIDVRIILKKSQQVVKFVARFLIIRIWMIFIQNVVLKSEWAIRYQKHQPVTHLLIMCLFEFKLHVPASLWKTHLFNKHFPYD